MDGEMLVKDSKPEFTVILDELSVEVDEMTNVSNVISSKVAILREFREIKPEKLSEGPQETISGIIPELQRLINTMRRENTKLREAKGALIQFIG